MSLSTLDILIVIVAIAMVLGVSIYARRYTRSVSDFLSANRCAGRYLLTVSSGMASLGAVSIVALWEKYYQGGFAVIHWAMMLVPVQFILALSGFVIYRYRQTRALTLAQFLEMRYSREFRVFAGFVCFLSGTLNYGIFPAVTGRFFIYFLDLPVYTSNALGLEVNWTLGLVMALTLSVALVITINGGQIAVLISDFVQGQLANICFLAVAAVLLWLIPWSEMLVVLKTAPEGQSMLNPFEQGSLPDFNPMYFVIYTVLSVYQYKVWQGNQGYNVSARSPHEAKMANVLGEFRAMILIMVLPVAAVAAWVLLHGNGVVQPDAMTTTQAQLDVLTAAGDGQLANQLTTTIAMKELLPVGVLGLLTALMLMATISTDSTYLHSWGSIFIQDVLMPIRQLRGKERMSGPMHLRALRIAILLVAAFAWAFSMVFPLQEYILMYFQITGAIFMGGAGAVLIGGLYWSRGTTAGAWAAMLCGSMLAVCGIVMINIVWPLWIPMLQGAYSDFAWVQSLPETFWFNGMEWSFGVALVSIAMYIGVSLLSPNKAVDFDKLYHRGKYAADAHEGADYCVQAKSGSIPAWQRSLGITEEFTLFDKLIFGLKYLLLFWQFGVGFIGLTIAYAVFGLMRSEDSWAAWWTLFLWMTGAISVMATIWFLIGGIRDLNAMFQLLRTMERDNCDDGALTD